ncbi:galactose-1-phosphate uridylyltransferase [Kwoniella heveanensis BCC8398]|uniref:Galactose-1-phosphate uridylyltransferase n=1 Tax=Kwoniella heveanensis BCC8398 TaxID=1296120 RepID=A0A1B9GZY6_9TREE|nr:galactose-1-phosphate uridylyltransferase [Kwoniella heveanensis BCC8398]
MTSDTLQVPFEPTEHPHRRFNPLTGKHVLVSPHRTKRPWKGQTEEPVIATLPHHEKECYLCPGNDRSGGHKNPAYKSTFTFENDFPALLPQAPPSPSANNDPVDSLFASDPVKGRCSVICFHPRHDLTLARMEEDDIQNVIGEWKRVYKVEGEHWRERGIESGYIQIFENRGSMMGASAPHPHGQVWSLSYVPDEPRTELENLSIASQKPSSSNSHPTRADSKPCLLCTYAAEEVKRGQRVVELDEEGGWVAVVPFWAVWPYEILVLPYKRHIPSLLQFTPEETAGLAKILKKVLVRYDNLFSCPFPYSMGLHQSPLPPTEPDSNIAHIHFHFYPPLLRSASVRKFLVGFEMMGEVQRDLTPEQAADKLRAVDERHYLDVAADGNRAERGEAVV